MDSNHVPRAWQVLCQEMRKRWTKLTDEDLEAITREPDQLLDRIQERYGMTKSDAERELRQWLYRVEIQF